MSVRSRSRSPLRSNQDTDGHEPRFLFVGNLPLEWNFSQIKEFLVDKYITDIDVIEGMGYIFTPKVKGKSTGECRITFDTVENCEKALQSLHDAECNGITLVVRRETKGKKSKSPMRSNRDLDEDELSYLFIRNLPNDWHFSEIKEFLVDKYFTDIDVIEAMGYIYMPKEKGQSKGDCVIVFDTAECCEKALHSLHDAECNGKKLIVKQGLPKFMSNPNTKLKLRKSFMEVRKQKYGQGPSRPSKPNKLYGLSEEFLQNLGIQPPICSRVFITNLTPEVTETKLREVFSLAGHVVSARRFQNWGKVEYDHPVEAVQAISMLNGQYLYKSKLIVQLDRAKNCVTLPEGLEAVGKGLGFSGKPMRAVRMTYELQPLKELLLNELSKLQNTPDNNPMATLSVNTNQAQNNPLLTLIQLLQEKSVGNAFDSAAQGSSLFNQNMFNNVQSQQTPPTSRFDIPPNALAFAQNPNMNSLGNAQNLLLNMNAMGNAQNPLANINAMNNTQNPMANMNVMGNRQNPMAIMNAMGNAQNPLTNMNAMGNRQNLTGNAQNPLANSNAMGNVHNPMGNLQAALANLQNVGQNQQAPRSRFDIPPSSMSNESNSGANQNWGSEQNDWAYQNTPQNHSSQGGRDNYRTNLNEFDMQKPSDSNNRSEDRVKSSDMLLFQDLPPSVTSKALINKMREVGELVLAEITGQGRAVVRFRHERDAERCVKLYDRSKVDGQLISVRPF